MEVKLFGEFEVIEEGVAIPVRGAKQRALLAMLALNRGNPVSSDRLIDQLWGDGKTANPTNALQAQIVQLRRTLGASAIVTSEAGYALNVSASDLDVSRFEDRITEGRRHSDNGDLALASAALSDALRLRRGEPLVEFAYAGFADGERAHLNELALVATEYRVQADLGLGVDNDLAGELEALCRNHPLRERLWELLMLALYRAGRQAEALRAYTEIRDRLVDELGIDPGPALRDLEARMIAQDPGLAGESPSESRVTIVAFRSGNLSAPLSSFRGRTTELEQVGQAIESSRLVTLVGPGGVGKTRLALATAVRHRDDYSGGAWLVELAGVTDPAAVVPTVASALGVSGQALGDDLVSGTATQLITRHLAGRSLIIVLDNCEHVIDEAAEIAQALVVALPGLRVVATSREPLGVPGEFLIPVVGLLPADAVELFEDRARAVQPGFASEGHAETVAGICRQLDGLPLAIELAAARLRALPLTTLAERLDDRFTLLNRGARTALPRQRTLRAVVDWSYELLFEDERRLFARLSVFVGGCELEAIESVCADERVPKEDVLDILSRLVDKSLVMAPHQGETRYSQLQTLWQYASDRLEESDEADVVRARHASYFRHFAENANENLRGAAGPACKTRLTPELANLKAALDWYLDSGDIDAALMMVSGMAWLWFVHSDFAEGARWLASALDADGSRRPELHASAQVWHGYFVGISINPAAGVTECDQGIEVLRGSTDHVGLAEALLLGATVLIRAYEFSRSLEALSEARALLDPDEQPWLVGAHDMLVSWNMASFGRLDEAEEAARSSIEHFDAIGEVLLVVNSLNALAGIIAAKGEIEDAAAAYEVLLQRCRAAGEHPYLNSALIALAALRGRQGDDAAADDLYQEAIGSSSNPWLSADAMVGQAAAARRLGDLVRAKTLLDTATARYEETGSPAGQPRVLAGLAWWALGADQTDAATTFAADAVRTAEAVGDPETQLLADCAFAAARAVADPRERNANDFVALARQRTAGPAHRSLSDEPDLVALAARLAPLAT